VDLVIVIFVIVVSSLVGGLSVLLVLEEAEGCFHMSIQRYLLVHLLCLLANRKGCLYKKTGFLPIG